MTKNPNDPVENYEILYRSVRDSELIRKESGEIERISSQAFNDANLEPSVDRAIFKENNPLLSQKSSSDFVISLHAERVRNEIIEKAGVKYALDIHPKPEPGNRAHAQIVPSPEYRNKEAFRKVKESLSKIAEIIYKP